MLRAILLLASNIPAALLSGAIFVFALFVMQFETGLACLVALCSYVIAGVWIFPSANILVTEKRPKSTFNAVLKETDRKVKHLRTLPYKIQNPDVRKQISNIYEIAAKIVTAMKQYPEDAVTARQFASYYLDSTIRIIEQYIALSEHTPYSAEVLRSVERVEATFDTIQAAFEKQLANLLRNEMLDLDTEIAVLEETLDLEGF
ncbi:hypothetical protein GF339_01790 [candidate division KSB3 bacterium]|uniref:5-bromo-4-chloroindolyl phosphate hydrolase n=1 Tax=candidate division KSB3 bacterium TaxID=2044937 RepID=A0A9D5JS62_9BACT|nr:hypothetical protein [candidate division KSB3 bacterium]MBD3323283.1 hypothetical protein [candidate division KSB3 bacterium]